MDCRNCGAPMELVDRRRYYHCNHCGTFHFIESPEVDGVRVLRARDAELPCPLCQAVMVSALLDERGLVDVHPYYGPGNIVIDSCSGCDLIWLDQGELKTITDAPPAAPLSPLLSLSDLWALLD